MHNQIFSIMDLIQIKYTMPAPCVKLMKLNAMNNTILYLHEF
jgi:hypothetical protein